MEICGPKSQILRSSLCLVVLAPQKSLTSLEPYLTAADFKSWIKPQAFTSIVSSYVRNAAILKVQHLKSRTETLPQALSSEFFSWDRKYHCVMRTRRQPRLGSIILFHVFRFWLSSLLRQFMRFSPGSYYFRWRGREKEIREAVSICILIRRFRYPHSIY